MPISKQTIISCCKGAYEIEDGGTLCVYLQRQGCSTQLNFVSGLFSMEFQPCPRNGYIVTLCYPNSYGFDKGGQVAKKIIHAELEMALSECIEAVKRLFAVEISFAMDVMAYCHDFGIGKEVTKDDYYFTPYLYDKERDGIVLACPDSADSAGDLVARFDGSFDKVKFHPSWGEGARHRIFAEKALTKGFHDCDRKKGDEFCKQRLIWLMAEYYKEFYRYVEVVKTRSLILS